MIKSSKSWMTEAQSWLAAPCTYTTAKCLSSHVHALKMVLDDSAQIRTTLQGFSSVLKEMSEVCDVTALEEQLMDADHQVAAVQDNFIAPLSQLEHAADEVEAIESEVRRMENDVAQIKTLLSSPETFPSPREESLKVVEQRIQSMRTTIAEIQRCKPGLCLPEKAEETLTVFTKVPALFIQQPPTPIQAKAPSVQQKESQPQLQKSTSAEAEREEQGQIRIVHVEEDVLKRSGAQLLTVEQSSPEQRLSRTPDSVQACSSVCQMYFYYTPTVFHVSSSGSISSRLKKPDVDVSDTTEASSSEANSKTPGTVRTQTLPQSMELMRGQRGLAWRGDDSQPEGLKTHPAYTHCTQAEDSFTPIQNTLTKDSCTHSEEIKDLTAVRSESETASTIPLSHATSAEQAEASEPITAPASTFRPQHQDDTEGLRPADAPEMFLEIEQKVASLSALGQATDQQQQQQQDELGAVGSQQEAAELLSSKLELLKSNLVVFQQLLMDKQVEEKTIIHKEPQEQTSVPQAERHLEPRLKRSSSVQEIFSSPRNKLLRQSSLQQQKELEQKLTEQRGLTQAIARQGSRARLHSLESEDHSLPSPRSPPAEADVEEDSAQKKWDRLHSRLLALEESWLLPPSEVTNSSGRLGDGTAGRMIGTQTVKELQTHIGHLRELGHAAAELLSPASPVDDGSRQTLDEGLFDVLSGLSLSLSSINNLLHSPARTTHEEDAQQRLLQLQSLSAELSTLGSELASQGSKVSGVLGSGSGQRCADDLCRFLPVVQAALTSREKQLRDLLEETAKQQAVVQMQESLQLQAEQVNSLLEEADGQNLPASLIHQATRLQGELDSTLGGVRSRCEELRSSVELQQQYERLVHSLKELLDVGSERLTQQPDTELQSRAQLQQQLNSHMKFFQFLGHHFHILQYLTQRVPESDPQSWEGVVTGLQDEVARLQQRGLERGTNMQETLQ
eukprot:superscaffoldBa00005798_g20789